MAGGHLHFIGADLHANIFPPGLTQIIVTRQRIEREGISIQVIFQVEHLRKPGAREFGFVPRPCLLYTSRCV